MAQQPKTFVERYQNMSYVTAQTMLAQRFTDPHYQAQLLFKLPPLEEIKTRRKFDLGDHWQNGDGFIGQLPSGEESDTRTDLLKKAFSPEDVISEVLDTHLENVLGDDPTISLESEDLSETELNDTITIVKEWFDKRENTKILADALRGCRRESARILRAFIPSGMIDGEGRITAKDLKDALNKIFIRSEDIENGGVLVDDATARELGLLQYQMKFDQQLVQLCEYSFLDDAGLTIWGTASNSSGNLGAELAEPLMLNGLLPIYQMMSKSFITPSVCQAQRDLNLSGTMLTRNNNLAGSRERLAVGVQPPGQWKEIVNDDGSITKKFEPQQMATGPATFNFLSAQGVFDSEGVIKSLANPNIIFTDPVPVDTFIDTSEHWRTVIYSKAKMRHLLMADNATASGRSRIEARKEFQSSLKESKQIVDAAGRWMIEVALHIAAHFIDSKGKFLKTRAKFEANISSIELTPAEIKEIREDYVAGIIDIRTALDLRGFKNPDEIIERLGASASTVLEDGVTLGEMEHRIDVASKGEGILPQADQLKIIYPKLSDAEITAKVGEFTQTNPVKQATLFGGKFGAANG